MYLADGKKDRPEERPKSREEDTQRASQRDRCDLNPAMQKSSGETYVPEKSGAHKKQPPFFRQSGSTIASEDVCERQPAPYWTGCGMKL